MCLQITLSVSASQKIVHECDQAHSPPCSQILSPLENTLFKKSHDPNVSLSHYDILQSLHRHTLNPNACRPIASFNELHVARAWAYDLS